MCDATLSGHTAVVQGVAWFAKRNIAASGSKDKSVRVWDMTTHACVAVLEGHADMVRAVTFSPTDANTLVTGGDDNDVRVWDLGKRACLAVLRHHTNKVRNHSKLLNMAYSILQPFQPDSEW